MFNLNLMDYAHLPVGETENGPCPTCGKRKFYVTRKRDGLAYICFRASCGTQGFVGDNTVPSVERKPKPARNYEYTGQIYDATDKDRRYFCEMFGVTDLDTDEALRYWIRQTGDGRYAFPLWGPDDRLRGHVLRRATWFDINRPWLLPPISDNYDEGFPKALTYIDPDLPRCGWYHSMDESTVVLVEDCVSAMRIATLGYTAVALLGTYLDRKVIAELIQWKNGKHYILALDPDAQQKAYKTGREWGGAFPGGLHVARLVSDPKDYESDEDLKRALGI